MFVFGPTVNAFPDEVGNIPVVRYAQKTGILMKHEKQEEQQESESDAAKKPTVVRTKRFEEWVANTGKCRASTSLIDLVAAKKAKKEPKPLSRSFIQTHINMTAEVRSKGTNILVNDGKVLVTREAR